MWINGNDELTEVQRFGKWWAKREDLYAGLGPNGPTGSKVRQYVKMAAMKPGATMIVGCSAHSAMQIYVAAAAKHFNVSGVVYTAKRAERTQATQYALKQGAEVIEGSPAYLLTQRARARERAKQIGNVVAWNPKLAFQDTAAQCANLPPHIKRVVVPTGSGLTAAGLLAGLRGKPVTVLAVAVSGLASINDIVATAERYAYPHGKILKQDKRPFPTLELVRAPQAYSAAAVARLPDGTVLDPYYAAKARVYIRDGDLFWIPGCRPLSAFPLEVLRELGL